MDINYQLKPEKERRTEPFTPTGNLGFGQKRTDHIFLMDFENGEWIDPRIIPYQNLSLAPGAMCIHYGQAIFEGAKAFMHEDDEIYTFRLDKNAERLNNSANILCMPNISVKVQIQAINALIDVDRLWFPDQKGACLYIRPFMFATEDHLSVRVSKRYTFCVVLSPSGGYYQNDDLTREGLRLLISKKYHRAVLGGLGAAKTGGNYAASLRAAEAAHQYNAAQVLYLDATNTQLEEVGSMNHFHVLKDGTVIIPEFTDSILKSITAQSILALGKVLGCEVRQETIYLEQFIKDVESGDIVEAGGLGTAAVVSPVGSYIFEDGKVLTVGDGKAGKYIANIYNILSNIQLGKMKLDNGWIQIVQRKAPV